MFSTQNHTLIPPCRFAWPLKTPKYYSGHVLWSTMFYVYKVFLQTYDYTLSTPNYFFMIQTKHITVCVLCARCIAAVENIAYSNDMSVWLTRACILCGWYSNSRINVTTPYIGLYRLRTVNCCLPWNRNMFRNKLTNAKFWLEDFFT